MYCVLLYVYVLLSVFRCCCCNPCSCKKEQHTVLVEDNCCQCNLAALKEMSGLKDAEIVYVTYHVDVSNIHGISPTEKSVICEFMRVDNFG